MKEIIKHNIDLFSIKPFNDNIWFDKVWFSTILRELVKIESWILFFAQRPQYRFSNSEKELIDNIIVDLYNGSYLFDKSKRHKYFGILFYKNIKEDFDESIFIHIYNLWFLYEQPTLVIADNITNLKKIKKKKLFNFSYDYFIIKSDYILFRGIEDDVLWIGKKSKNTFPDFEKLERNLILT